MRQLLTLSGRAPTVYPAVAARSEPVIDGDIDDPVGRTSTIGHIAPGAGTRYPEPGAGSADCRTGRCRSDYPCNEDRRHIQDATWEILREVIQTRHEHRMALTDEMIANTHAQDLPQDACLVPERREELTTERRAGRGALSIGKSYHPGADRCRHSRIAVHRSTPISARSMRR